MAWYLIYDSEGVGVNFLAYQSTADAIGHAKLMLTSETLGKREPIAYYDENRMNAMVGLADNFSFVPHYFIRKVTHVHNLD